MTRFPSYPPSSALSKIRVQLMDMHHECDTTNGFQLYLIIDRISTVRTKKKEGNMGMLMCMINANPIIICPIFSYGLTFTWKTYIMLFTILWA